jgi:predicted phage terminase large subunit-like protein
LIQLTPETIEGFVGSVLAPHFDKTSPTPDFHRELWQLCCSEHPLVAIAAPRGHAKSTAVSLSYVLAATLFRDRQFVLLVSDTEGQAKEFLGDIKKELQANEHLINLFGIKGFQKDTETDIIVEMDDGYLFRIIAKGSEQKVRGMKWNHKRPDLIVCDDMENDEIVMNQERRDKFKSWVIKALLPCRGPNGIVRVVGTILHLDSFLANVVPMEGYKHTKREGLKLVSTNPRPIWHGVVYAAHEGNTPYEVEKDNATLWPARFDKDWFIRKYEEAVALGKSDGYSQEYLNKPLDDANAMFRKSDFVPFSDQDKKDIQDGKKPLLHYMGVDLAISEKEKSDWSVFMVFGMDADGYLFHRTTIRARMDGREIVDTILRLQRHYDLQWVAIEQDKIAKSIGPFLREEMLRRGEFVTVVPISAHNDPQVRVRSIQARLRCGGVKFDHNNDEFEVLKNEFLTFPRGKHDDQVFAAACVGLGLDKMAQAQTWEEQAEDEYQDELQQSGVFFDGRNSITGY